MHDSHVVVRRAYEDELPKIWQLTHDAYVWRGYIDPQPGGIFAHYQHLERIPETTQLVAFVDDQLVGTCTYTFDGPDGLQTDHDYPYETGIIRSIGLPLACVWRLATVPECRKSHYVVRELITVTLEKMLEAGGPYVLSIVNPRHALYYAKRVGYRMVAQKKETDGLSKAPSVLMIVGLEDYRRSLCGR